MKTNLHLTTKQVETRAHPPLKYRSQLKSVKYGTVDRVLLFLSDFFFLCRLAIEKLKQLFPTSQLTQKSSQRIVTSRFVSSTQVRQHKIHKRIRPGIKKKKKKASVWPDLVLFLKLIRHKIKEHKNVYLFYFYFCFCLQPFYFILFYFFLRRICTEN